MHHDLLGIGSARVHFTNELVTTMKVWSGSPPCTCELCGDVIIDEFVDGKLREGPWALMCPGCHSRHGDGFGTGRGQLYERRTDKWVLAEGSQ